MTQTLYAHMNKLKIKKKQIVLLQSTACYRKSSMAVNHEKKEKPVPLLL
jgi:hypothetical protein